MKLRRPSTPVLMPVPALIAKRAAGGTSWRGVDEYSTTKHGAQLLSTNMEGTTPRERAREVAHLRTGSKLRRAVDHWSLSLNPRLGKLTDDQWREAADIFLQNMGYQGCAFTLVRHSDTDKDHVHLLCLRLRGDGSVASDSNDFKRGHAAAIAAADRLGLKPLPPRPDAARLPSATDSQVNSNKRARSRGTKIQNHASVVRIFDYVVAKTVNLEELETASLEAGLELQIIRKSGGEVQGLNVRAAGAEDWQKASRLRTDRSLSWSRVEARLNQNATILARAEESANSANAAARAQAAARVEARLARQLEPVPPQARSLLPTAVTFAKESIVTEAADPLNFLSSPPPPRPLGQQFDDIGLAPARATGSQDEPPAKEDGEHARRLREIEEAVDAHLRMHTISELFDAKNASVPPVFLKAELLIAMINLIIRLFTLFFWKGTNVLAEQRLAKEFLAQRAELELLRRRRRQQTVQERFLALDAHEAAARARVAEMGKRALERAQARLHPEHATAAQGQRRRELEAGYDRLQVHLKKKTFGERKLALAEAEARVARRQARVDADVEVVGMFGLRVPKGTSAKAQAIARAASLAAAQRAREAAQAAWDSADEAVGAEQKREQAVQAAAAAAAFKAEQWELQALEIELGKEVPAARRQLDGEALRERIGALVRGAAAEGEGTGADAEPDGARAEWLRLMRRGG